MQIELDAFSGRPNPSWTLTEDQAARLMGRLAALNQITSEKTAPDDLGFRGFILTSEDLRIRVCPGLITVEERGQRTTYRDTTGVYDELIKEARTRDFGGIVGN